MFAPLLLAAALLAPPLIAAPILSHPSVEVLPEGRLMLMSGSEQAAFFLAMDETKVKGSSVDAMLYTVLEPPILGDTVQTVEHLTLDCRARTFVQTGAASFGEDGKLKLTLPGSPVADIEDKSTHDFITQVMCPGANLPPFPSVQGHAAALKAGREAVRALR